MKEIHKSMFELLCEFDDFCEKYNIEYSLGWGTLLGCVREGAFIEWDDDLDIMISLDNLKKLKAVANNLPSHLSTKIYSLDSQYYNTEAHKFYSTKSFIVDSKNIKHNVSIDLFDLKETGSLISIITRSFIPIFHRRRFPKGSWKRRYLGTLRAFWKLIWPILFYLCDHQKTKNYLNYRYFRFRRWGFKKEDVFPVKKDSRYTLYGRSFPVPNNPEEILSITYGKDWKTPYKDPDRIHFS